MNYGIVVKIIGNILMLESLLMIPALLVSLINSEQEIKIFLITIIITFLVGLILSRKENIKKNINAKEGLLIVAISWVLISVFGALPLFLSKSVPTFADALFETVSGFTTTGATVIEDVEVLSKGILFWRSFTHWIGGMGILVFTLALLPALGIGGLQIFKAESPGPVAGKIAPRLKDTAKILYTIYFSITIIQVIFLLLGKMSLFESLVYTFGTVGTGGLATKNASVGAYSSYYIQLVIGFFMLFSGINFSLYYLTYHGRFKEAIKDEELRLYLKIVTISVILICLNLFFTNYGSFLLSLKDAFFQVSSIITTTGYSTTDFNTWPSFSKAILVLLMFTGGSAGSTAGGMKIIRILVLLKLIKREILKIFHPRAVIPIKVNGRVMSEETVEGINSYMSLYMIIIAISTILISLEDIDLVSSFTSVAATLGNIGPGLNLVGPASNFSSFSGISKIYFSLLMLLGRLELFTILALIAPKNWRKEI